jgi:hypothetical protein
MPRAPSHLPVVSPHHSREEIPTEWPDRAAASLRPSDHRRKYNHNHNQCTHELVLQLGLLKRNHPEEDSVDFSHFALTAGNSQQVEQKIQCGRDNPSYCSIIPRKWYHRFESYLYQSSQCCDGLHRSCPTSRQCMFRTH